MDISETSIISKLQLACERICTNTFAINVLFFIVSEKDYDDNEIFRVQNKKDERIILSSNLKDAKEISAFLDKQFKENEICYAELRLFAVNRYVNIVRVGIRDMLYTSQNHDIFYSVSVPPKNDGKKFDLNWPHSKFFMFRLWLLSLKLKWTGVID